MCLYICTNRLSGENCHPALCLLSLSSVITMPCQVLLVKSLVNEELELRSFHLTRWCTGCVRSLRTSWCYKISSMMLCTSQLETRGGIKWGLLYSVFVLGWSPCHNRFSGMIKGAVRHLAAVTCCLVTYRVNCRIIGTLHLTKKSMQNVSL